MRPVREISAEEENFRIEPHPFLNAEVVKRDPVEPEPVGTIVLLAFQIMGYDRDCDGSLMARLERIDKTGDSTGWVSTAIGLYPNNSLVVTQEEWEGLFRDGEVMDHG